MINVKKTLHNKVYLFQKRFYTSPARDTSKSADHYFVELQIQRGRLQKRVQRLDMDG